MGDIFRIGTEPGDAERRLRDVSRAARLSYMEVDFGTRRVHLAENFEALSGLVTSDGECAIGPHGVFGLDRVAADDRSQLSDALSQFLAGTEVPSLCFNVADAHSTRRAVEVVFSIERGPGDEARTGFATFIDVTERLRSAQVLRESEARYRSALKAGRMGAWETDFIEQTRTWSEEGLALFGLDLPGGRGQVGGPADEYQRALHPDDRHLVGRFHEQVQVEDSFPAEYRIVRPDGTVLWLAGRGLVVSRRPDGRAHRLVSIMADVTERRAAEEQLRIERQRVAQALDAGLMGAFDFDVKNDVLWWSPRTYEIFGVTPEAFTPTRESVGARIHPEDRAFFLRERAEAIARRRALQLEFRIVHPDGREVWIAHRGQTAWDPSGNPARHYGVVMDVTERRLAEQQLREADRQKDDFVATLAHELRNPLAPIRNAVNLMRRLKMDDPQTVWCREVIDRQVGQMARLLDDLLDLSRMTRDRLDLRLEPTTLASVVAHAVEIAQPVIHAAAHALDVDLPTQAVRFVGDPARLAQVLSNLLINSAKYTPSGGRIALQAEEVEGHLRISVTDNGIGIAPHQLPLIFDMFSQGDAARERSQGGLGIGLALARRLVDMHGGTVSAHSDGEGRGSVFVVSLPVRRPAERLDTPAEPPSAAVTGPRSLRILVADDLRDGADSLALELQAMGHRVRVVYDGEQALRVGASFLPEVAILDLGMPGLDGLETSRRIRATPWGRGITLIAQSGWGQATDRQRTRDAGFDHHLVKPIQAPALGGLLDAVTPGSSG